MQSWLCVVSEPELNHEERIEKATPADSRSRVLHGLSEPGRKSETREKRDQSVCK